MTVFKRFIQNSSPVMKTLMAISITSAIVVGHKLFYAPYRNRMRYRKAEEWASHIIEQEEQANESEERTDYS